MDKEKDKEKVIMISFFNRWKQQDSEGYNNFIDVLIKMAKTRKRGKKLIQ